MITIFWLINTVARYILNDYPKIFDICLIDMSIRELFRIAVESWILKCCLSSFPHTNNCEIFIKFMLPFCTNEYSETVTRLTPGSGTITQNLRIIWESKERNTLLAQNSILRQTYQNHSSKNSKQQRYFDNFDSKFISVSQSTDSKSNDWPTNGLNFQSAPTRLSSSSPRESRKPFVPSRRNDSTTGRSFNQVTISRGPRGNRMGTTYHRKPLELVVLQGQHFLRWKWTEKNHQTFRLQTQSWQTINQSDV